MKVFIGVVAYHHYSALKRCVDSIMRQTYNDIEVFIYDNSEPEFVTYEPADLVENKAPRFITSHRFDPTNIMWTPALNVMLREADYRRADYFLTLNHDVQLAPTTVEELVRAFSELPEHAGAVGPCGHGMGGQQGWSVQRSAKRERVNFLIGACTMYKMDVFDEVGLFDEDMPLSGDDFDFAIRMKEAGYSLWVNEGAPYNHESHLTRASENWDGPAKRSWDAFNKKYDGYYANETEARLGLWNGPYDPQYPIGTGISDEEKRARGIIK